METTTEVETKQPSVAPSEPQQQTPVAETPTTTEMPFRRDSRLKSTPEEPSVPIKEERRLSSANGVKPPALDDDDTANDDDLSPPPENLSPVSGSHDRALEDEIVVGNRNGVQKSSPLRVVSDPEDENMADVEDEPVVSHYPKRKRASVFNDLSEDKMESSLVSEKEGTPRGTKPARRHGLGGVKGVILGYWRDSPVPDPRGKHAVIGFIDVRDRLRTRIQQNTRFGEPVSSLEYPLPPGPGGSWVTFERVVFADHLVGLDHHQVKEYVKLRTDSIEMTEEARDAAEQAAAKEAVRRVEENPPPENPVAPAIAYGAVIPDHATMPARPDSKRRRTGSGIGTISGGPVQQTPPAQNIPPTPQFDPLPGTRPTRIIVGYWKGSSEPDPINKHAIYGILGQNDMFRVKVARETRDKRFVDGNFPVGAGALWIHWEEVELEPHIKVLSRPEVKEYCRVRQYQIDQGESPNERVENEARAVYEAQQRVANGINKPGYMNNMGPPPAIVPQPEEMLEAPETKVEANPELRQSRRTENRGVRHSLPDLDVRQSSRTPVQAQNKIDASARREIARIEAAQIRTERFAADREAAQNAQAAQAAQVAQAAHMANLVPPPMPPQAMPKMPLQNGNGNGPRMSSLFHERDEMQRLNKVWASQEEHRSKVGGEETKFYGGIKYERKTNGPFVGKLVSQGTIISIDGEDYVEYRVLTKPSFF
ncbi:hypothetical protein CPAR01_15703 [Colletotrichum paranaense]|uniref:tRNA splicing endonuclease subunit n=1 Tax=Colletotrichum paranaense TaxID=1914294 RepID=A0ABQ9RZB5_9PEZI|nr:uncharacterized protein CPAR01_15703 [Colletotrichum paranaense]KAK1519265.1 hypothetical protein CPAR01_15703 [Colletotrichum paranaense]